MSQFGPYTLLRTLGVGGMGIVYLAEHPDRGRVALKTIHSRFATPQLLERFSREVNALRRVRRWCTAPLLDADLSAESPYLVTEYVSGPNLEERVLRAGVLRESELEAVAVGMALALDAIHAVGIAHRDMKPGNVILSPYGPRVIDFGIASLMGTTSDLTQPGLHMGTPPYMSPEQARGEAVGPWEPSDVFAWAATVVFAANGRPPFGPNDSGVYSRIQFDDPDLGELHGELRDLVSMCLAKPAAERPTMPQLLGRLKGMPVSHSVVSTAAVSESASRVREQPTRAGQLAREARRSLDGGWPRRAQGQAEKGLHFDDRNAACLAVLGLSLIALGLNERGLDRLRHGHEIAPDDPQIALEYAGALANTGEEAAVDRAFQLAPDTPEIRGRYVTLLLKRAGEDAAGDQHAAHAFDLAPGNADVIQRYVQALIRQGTPVSLARALMISDSDPLWAAIETSLSRASLAQIREIFRSFGKVQADLPDVRRTRLIRLLLLQGGKIRRRHQLGPFHADRAALLLNMEPTLGVWRLDDSQRAKLTKLAKTAYRPAGIYIPRIGVLSLAAMAVGLLVTSQLNRGSSPPHWLLTASLITTLCAIIGSLPLHPSRMAGLYENIVHDPDDASSRKSISAFLALGWVAGVPLLVVLAFSIVVVASVCVVIVALMDDS
ncbi:protein kinase [Actinomadura graeca]|uniref:Protein kinase n=1 Tax=Actinomadura graeca TaxID=2750812 RepID=A0ABX8R4L0_9ACTN|nr:serine/threonine-protein kinase [Actinomadura graeca]QXJ25768.1 protein kinase [Actinomadura graeca]